MIKFVWKSLPAGFRAWVYKHREAGYRRWLVYNNRSWDRRLNVSTETRVKYSDLSERERQNLDLLGNEYTCVGTPYRILLKVRERLALQSDDVVFDLGCGEGRALFVFAGSPALAVVGSERNLEAVNSAHDNVRTFRGAHWKISILRRDVRELNYSQATVLYLFNPFGLETLQAVLDRVEASLAENPRRLRVAYYNPRFHGEFLKRGFRERPGLKGMLFEVAMFETVGRDAG